MLIKLDFSSEKAFLLWSSHSQPRFWNRLCSCADVFHACYAAQLFVLSLLNSCYQALWFVETQYKYGKKPWKTGVSLTFWAGGQVGFIVADKEFWTGFHCKKILSSKWSVLNETPGTPRTFCLTSPIGPPVPASYQPVSSKFLRYTVSTAPPRLQTSRPPGDPLAVELLHTFHLQ